MHHKSQVKRGKGMEARRLYAERRGLLLEVAELAYFTLKLLFALAINLVASSIEKEPNGVPAVLLK